MECLSILPTDRELMLNPAPSWLLTTAPQPLDLVIPDALINLSDWIDFGVEATSIRLWRAKEV